MCHGRKVGCRGASLSEAVGPEVTEIFAQMPQVWDRRALGRGAKPAGVLVGHTEGLTFLDPRGAPNP